MDLPGNDLAQIAKMQVGENFDDFLHFDIKITKIAPKISCFAYIFAKIFSKCFFTENIDFALGWFSAIRHLAILERTLGPIQGSYTVH